MPQSRSESTAMALSQGFPPVAPAAARVLILGSLPGRMSLARQQYYGQPRNAFWSIMGALCGAAPELDYGARIRRLERAGIALWDVLAAAHRPGSLDSAIARDTMEINDFVSLFARCSGVRAVFLNGLKAADLYRRAVLPTLPPAAAALPLTTLPSTSPAYAGMPQARKLELWRAALEPFLDAADPAASQNRNV